MKNNNARQEAARRAIPQIKKTITDPVTIVASIDELFKQLDFRGKTEVMKILRDHFKSSCELEAKKVDEEMTFIKQASSMVF